MSNDALDKIAIFASEEWTRMRGATFLTVCISIIVICLIAISLLTDD